MIKKKKKGEWLDQVTKDMKTLDIEMSLEEMERCSKIQLKKIIRDKYKDAYLKEINRQKGLLSKGKEISYQRLNIQENM